MTELEKMHGERKSERDRERESKMIELEKMCGERKRKTVIWEN